jgi:hypothetical protein
MLRRFVIARAQLATVPPSVDVPFTVLSDTDEPRASAVETKGVVSTTKPTYCEVPLEQLDEVRKAGSSLKVRTGGVTPEAIPSVESVASSITACADRGLAFKATAGLHHPLRSVHPLTYEADSATAMMHGFINVFLGASFVWRDAQDNQNKRREDGRLRSILAETDPAAFRFDERAHWRDHSLSAEEITEARRAFAHSFGSCSFEEPILDLQAFHLL